MPEPVDAEPPKENPIRIPRGEVILGHTDPKNISKDQFNSSPDLLWHGSAKAFEYDPNFDLDNNPSDNGATLGYGFYATDTKSDAELFSMAFMRGNDPREPISTEVLPYEAKMYDFRDIADIKENANVPIQMEKDFALFYESYFQRLYPNGRPTEGLMGMVYDLNQEYGDILSQRAQMGETLDLRGLLSRGGKGRDVFGSAAQAFTKYMQSIGYDGVVYVEGGDHPDHNDPASYAFYNMHKIGTYESWHNIPNSEQKVEIPHIKPVGVGVEYGKKLEGIAQVFEEIRHDGFYAADENRETPRFSQSIALHGFGGTYKIESLGRDVIKLEDGSETSFPKQKFTFIPPSTDIIHGISNIGILSSDIEFEGRPSVREGAEEETSGCADFNMQSHPFESMSEFLSSLPQGTFADFVTKSDESEASAVVMFAFDTSRPELAPLIQHAMKDTDSNESLWPNRIVPGQDYFIAFPAPGSGTHLAVPVGLPANYIEYIVVNEKSPYWQGERLDQLRKSAVVDGHTIPLVSIHTNTVI